MITLNTPGQDFGKYSQGHDRKQKAWNRFVEYLTQPKNICNETTPSKINPPQLFLEFDLKQGQISNKQPRTGHKIHLWMCLAFTPRLCLTLHVIMSRSWIWESSKIMERAKKNLFVPQRTNGDYGIMGTGTSGQEQHFLSYLCCWSQCTTSASTSTQSSIQGPKIVRAEVGQLLVTSSLREEAQN